MSATEANPDKKSAIPIEEFVLGVFGGSGVGKSCITVRFLQNNFLTEHDPTIEDCYTMTREIENVPCHIKVYDTAGQEEYGALRPHYIREAEGFLLVYSIIDRESFETVVKIRDQIIQAKEEDVGNVPIILIGNKDDLEEQRQVPKEDGEKRAAEFNIPFIETSAKARHNIDEAFVLLVNEIRKDRKLKEAQQVQQHGSGGKENKRPTFKCVLL